MDEMLAPEASNRLKDSEESYFTHNKF